MLVFTRVSKYTIITVCYRHREEVGVMNLKKILTFAFVALVLFLLIKEPEMLAGAIQQVLSWLRQGAESIITFIRSLF